MATLGRNERDTKLIINKYRNLLRAVHSISQEDNIKMLRKAFNIALDAANKKPVFMNEHFIMFPLDVSRTIAKEMGMGGLSVVCALLYPFVRDNDISITLVKKELGDKTAMIVESLAKISEYGTRPNLSQAEELSKMILTISKDVRVIVIKLAEHLYMMRHVHKLPAEQQRLISESVQLLYAPLAHRLGLYNIKTELEDLALKNLEPDLYKSIETKLRNTTVKRNRFIRKFIHPIKMELDRQGFKTEIKGRTKSIYSIWNKMKKQQVEFEEIYDIFAIRIIINEIQKDEKSDCWSVYSVVANLYQPNPRRMRDWISIPKSNGYESLHTTVLGPGGKWVEVQIRSKRMNEIAEKGLAAHWKYKGGKEDQRMEEWLSKVRDMLETAELESPRVIDEYKLELYEDEVFVFTPNGDLKKFPKGATVLDFAFEIHSHIGEKCTGARINNRNVPIRHVLSNGDQVEILTSKNQKPKSDWLGFVVTSKAKTRIKHLLKEETYKEAEVGKEILKRRLKNWKILYNDENVNRILKHFRFNNAIDLNFSIATEKIDISQIKDIFFAENEKARVVPVRIEKPIFTQQSKSADLLILDGSNLDNVEYKLAKCCNPVLGDEIFGFVTVSEGIKIHRITCPNAQQLLNKYNYRVIKAYWTEMADDVAFFESVVIISGIDETGLVNDISNIISHELKLDMRSISFETNNGMFEGKIKVMVKNNEQLNTLIDRLGQVKGVLKIARYEGIQ